MSMSDSKKLSQFINDINNLNASEKTVDDFLVELRQAQLEYRKSMEQFNSWTSGEGAVRMHQWSESFFSELAKHIHRLEDNQIEIVETKQKLEILMRSELTKGPKW